MNRRDFLRAALAVGVSAWLPWPEARASTPGRGPTRMVLIHLFGGNDGLNTVVPLGNSAYRQARPRLALGANETLPLGQGLGLHRALEPLLPLWQQGRLAILNGVGYPQPNRSHFVSSDIWHTARLRGDSWEGWLGRYLDDCPEPAVNLDDTMSRALWSRRGHTLCLKTPESFRLASGTPREELGELYRQAGGGLGEAFQQMEQGLEVCRHVCEGEAVQGGDLGKSLAVVLRLLPRARVLHVTMGGFDTHSEQKGRHAEVLGDLARALTGFWKGVERARLERDTLVVVYSEFGRRVEENASQGTDHGAAGPLLVLGQAVRGGFHGEYPSLERLQEGDLVHTVDFRSVYATLLEGWLEVDSLPVLGERHPTLPLLGRA